LAVKTMRTNAYEAEPGVAEIIEAYWPANGDKSGVPAFTSDASQAVFLRVMREMQAALIRFHAPRMDLESLTRAKRTLQQLESSNG